MNINRGHSQSISINNGVITINGKRVDTGNEKQINITIEGDCGSIDADSCSTIEVKGKVTYGVKTMSGDVKCGDVDGGVNTMSGDVRASKISGSVNTMSGDIN